MNLVKKIGAFAAVAALALATFFSASQHAGAQVTFTQQYAPGDVTHILGSQPYFPNGRTMSPGATEYELVPDSDSVPASVGKFVYYKWSTGTWIQEATASAAAPSGTYGVVVTQAVAKGANALIQVSGFVNALCVTGGTTAIAPGTPLGFDGSGNVTPILTPATGTVVAVGNGTLAISQGQTLVNVFVGGY